MRSQCGLQIRDRLRQLSGLDLRDSYPGLIVHALKMWNRLGRIALREQGVAEQLVGWRQVCIHIQRMLQRCDCGTEIVLLHVGLAETDVPVCVSGRKLSDLAKLRDRDIELSLF